MSYVNIDAMDEAIADFKAEKRKKYEDKIIDLAEQIEKIMREYNSDADYLHIVFGAGRIEINNAFWNKSDADHECPIYMTRRRDGEREQGILWEEEESDVE